MELSLQQIISEKLKPYVRKIDAEAYYAKDYLTTLGQHGFYQSLGQKDYIWRELRVIEATSQVCMTTAFNLWCHFAALTYLRNTSNTYLQKEILPLLEQGVLLGGTGLSNPMKFYAGLEPLHLTAREVEDGYSLSGCLPNVSNLGEEHWFGVIAQLTPEQEIMAILPCKKEQMRLKEKTSFMGLNGSATYSCQLDQYVVPRDWIISEQAREFVKLIRPLFLLYQLPLGLGVIEAAIHSIEKAGQKQKGANRFLKIQADDLKALVQPLRQETYALAQRSSLTACWMEIVRLRLKITELTIKAVHANMLHHGGAAYLEHSEPARRLRESYFLVNLTPTISHLEKMIQNTSVSA